MSIISVENLTKDYGRGRGIFNVSFEVEKGEIYGYVGTNGSGKTTTIRNMLGFVFPDSGKICIDGLDPSRQAAELMRHVSYIPGEIAFPSLPTGTDFLKLQAEYNGVTDFTYMNYVADKLDLDTTANLKRMSKGMKQKTAIVAALMADRDILVLDEPTTGLDPLQRDNFLELLRGEKEKGKTIFLSGHIFEELEEVCDRVAMLKDGRILGVVNMHDLRHKTDRNYEITFISPQSAAAFAARIQSSGCAEGTPGLPETEDDGLLTDMEKAGMQDIRTNDCKVTLSLPPEMSGALFRAMARYKILNIRETNVTLEDVFMKEYRK
ncbi:MAG: ATP-binding cassette domain-containing protein [Clostridia bacterium]|nr:ATP-binding cassette domain-containing protein [Clostridia bacterium]